MQYNYVLIYIIYGDRTIIGFVRFVVNLLNRPADGTTVQRLKKCVRKRITFRPLLRTPKNIISNLAPFPGRFKIFSRWVNTVRISAEEFLFPSAHVYWEIGLNRKGYETEKGYLIIHVFTHEGRYLVELKAAIAIRYNSKMHTNEKTLPSCANPEFLKDSPPKTDVGRLATQF
jgi:hypothetical protein